MAIIAQNTFTLKRLAKDAVTYYLVPSVNIVRRSGTTNVPVSVSCVKMKQVGSDAAAVTTDHTLYKSIDGGADSVYSGAVTVGTANTITFRLKDGGGTVIASSTVVVLEDELFSKNDIAQQLGYADWAAMVAAKTGGNPIITAAGLINANIIDVETLVALEAFITKVITRQLQSAADIRQSSILIHSPDPEDEDDEAYIRVGNTGFYIKLSVSGDEYPDIIPKISIRWNDDNHISTLDVKPDGVFVKGKNIVPGASTEYGVKFTAWGVEAFELVDGITKTSSRIINHWYGTAITGTETTPTIFSSSGITLAVGGDVYINTSNGNIYECQTGGVPGTATWVYIGRPSYSASEVGAAASTHSHNEFAGVTAVTTLVSVPITYRSVSANINTTAKGTISLASALPAGKELMLHIVASAALTVSFASTTNITFMDDENWSMASGDVIEISIWCYKAGYYSVSSKVRS